MATGRPGQRAVGQHGPASPGFSGQELLSLRPGNSFLSDPGWLTARSTKASADSAELVSIPKPHQLYLEPDRALRQTPGMLSSLVRASSSHNRQKPGQDLSSLGRDWTLTAFEASLAGAGVNTAAMKAWRWAERGKELRRLRRSHTHKTSHFLTKKKIIYIYNIYLTNIKEKRQLCKSPHCLFIQWEALQGTCPLDSSASSGPVVQAVWPWVEASIWTCPCSPL